MSKAVIKRTVLFQEGGYKEGGLRGDFEQLGMWFVLFGVVSLFGVFIFSCYPLLSSFGRGSKVEWLGKWLKESYSNQLLSCPL